MNTIVSIFMNCPTPTFAFHCIYNNAKVGAHQTHRTTYIETCEKLRSYDGNLRGNVLC
jgi:hypothetical protein